MMGKEWPGVRGPGVKFKGVKNEDEELKYTVRKKGKNEGVQKPDVSNL